MGRPAVAPTAGGPARDARRPGRAPRRAHAAREAAAGPRPPRRRARRPGASWRCAPARAPCGPSPAAGRRAAARQHVRRPLAGGGQPRPGARADAPRRGSTWGWWTRAAPGSTRPTRPTRSWSRRLGPAAARRRRLSATRSRRRSAHARGRVAQFLHWEYGRRRSSGSAPSRAPGRGLGRVDARPRRDARGGMDPGRVALVPLGVDPERFRPGAEPLDLGDRAPGVRAALRRRPHLAQGHRPAADSVPRAFTAQRRRHARAEELRRARALRARRTPTRRCARSRPTRAAPRILHLTDRAVRRRHAAAVRRLRRPGAAVTAGRATGCRSPRRWRAACPRSSPTGAPRGTSAGRTRRCSCRRGEVPMESATIGGMLVAGRPRGGGGGGGRPGRGDAFRGRGPGGRAGRSAPRPRRTSGPATPGTARRRSPAGGSRALAA